jgi:hypothetical protein
MWRIHLHPLSRNAPFGLSKLISGHSPNRSSNGRRITSGASFKRTLRFGLTVVAIDRREEFTNLVGIRDGGMVGHDHGSEGASQRQRDVALRARPVA